MNIKLNKQKGLSLVEMMIAVFIGLILILGLISIFDTSSRLNRTQNGLARIQENGRYALTIMREHIQQAGYSYCLGETNLDQVANRMSSKVPWDIRTAGFLPGLPVGGNFLDTAYFIHGHECGASSCTPAINLPGTGSDIGIPAIGTTVGSRVAGTDVVTVRYLRGRGREVQSIGGPLNPNLITFTNYAANFEAPTTINVNGQAVIINCEDQPPIVVDYTANSSTSMTAVQFPGASTNLTRVFDLASDFMTVTYYVQLDSIIDGASQRLIPTLYSQINGVSTPIIQGVDDFDVLYGVKTDDAGNVLMTDATGVEGAPCSAVPMSGNTPITNPAPNCGWRSVASMEIHLLLNTIFNSTVSSVEPFRYAPYGTTQMVQSNIEARASIPDYNNTETPYRMIRKEFFSAIALKNIVY